MDRKQEMLNAMDGKFRLCPPNPDCEKELKEISVRYFQKIRAWKQNQNKDTKTEKMKFKGGRR